MNAARLVKHIELALPLLVVVAWGVGWLFFRKRTGTPARHWRTGFVVAGVITIQILIAHSIYMKGFDHGAAGQPRDEAYLSFYHTASYIAEDLHVYDNPFLELLLLFALNTAFLWLLRKERRGPAGSPAAPGQDASQAPPRAEGT